MSPNGRVEYEVALDAAQRRRPPPPLLRLTPPPPPLLVIERMKPLPAPLLFPPELIRGPKLGMENDII